MNNVRLPTTDSSTGRGIKTGIQSILGTLVVLGVGLILAIKGVPGCPDAIINFAEQNFATIAGSIGLSSGLISFLYNLIFRSSVQTY